WQRCAPGGGHIEESRCRGTGAQAVGSTTAGADGDVDWGGSGRIPGSVSANRRQSIISSRQAGGGQYVRRIAEAAEQRAVGKKIYFGHAVIGITGRGAEADAGQRGVRGTIGGTRQRHDR